MTDRRKATGAGVVVESQGLRGSVRETPEKVGDLQSPGLG